MKRGDFVGKVRAKYPDYKDVPDDELFIRVAKNYPSYIQNDEELKEEFLRLANQNEAFGSGVVKLSPEKAYNLITSIPEYKPPKSEYLEFGKHDPDVDWMEAGSAAVSYLGNMVAEGFSWDEDAYMAGTVVEGAAQGTRALYGMLGESTDPNSVFFKGKALLSSLFSPDGDDAGYKQWLAARDFAQQTLRYEEGKDQILPDSIPVNRKAAVALGLGLDPSLFVSFGGGTIGKLATKATGAGLRGTGRAAKVAGKAVAMPMEKAMTAASEAITKAVPGVPEQTVKGTAIAATGMGAVATPVGQTVGTVYGAAKGAETLGDIALGVGEQMGKQPTRMGVFAGMAADPTKSKLTRGVSRAASVLGGDTALTAAGAATRGAFEGGVVGAGLGYGTAREQGAAGGLAGGAAFGVVGGTTGAAFRRMTGSQRRSAIKADFGRFLAETSKRSEAEALAVSEFVGGDLTKTESLNRAAEIMDLHNFAKGSSGEDVIVTFLNEKAFAERFEGQKARGAQLIKGDRPEIVLNTGYKTRQGHTMAHEVFHAVGKLDGMKAYKGRLKDAIMGVRGSGDEVLHPGLLNESQLRDLATQYARKLNKQNRAEWMENWRDNTIEELSAEAFATLITGSKPDALLAGKGFDTLTRRALDRLILADSESRIGMMRNAMTRAFGVEFDPVVKEPTASVAFKGEKGNPLRNHSPAVNAILRDMVRAKRAIADHHALDNKLVSKNFVRTRGLSNKEMAKFQEQFKDNPMSELFTTDKKGNIKMVKGSEAGVLEKETANKVVDAIESAVDTGDALEIRKQVSADGKVEYTGLRFSKEQMDAINKADIHPRIKEFLNLMQESLGDGRMFDTEYWAATRRDPKGQPVYASLKSTRRNVVPYSINISREGNFYARALDITALDKKFRQWRNRNTEWLRHWDNPNEFYEDAMKYLQNLASGDAVPSAKLFGETKRNILNEFIGARGRAGLNPLALEKMAEKEFLIRNFRLDRIASMHLDNSQKRFPFSEEVYRLNQANFLPVEDPHILKDVPTIKPSDLHKLPGFHSLFPILADLTEAAAVYRGIDSSRIPAKHGVELHGGPKFLRQAGSLSKRLLWAFKSKAKITAVLNRAKQTNGYAVVTAMMQDSHMTNPSYVDAALKTIKAYIDDGKISPEGIDLANKSISDIYQRTRYNKWAASDSGKKAKKDQKNLMEEKFAKEAESIPDIRDTKKFFKWQYDVPQGFEMRGAIAKELGLAKYEEHNFPASRKMVDAVRGGDHAGLNYGDALYIMRLDLDQEPVTLGEDGYPSHPSYSVGLRGEVVGKFSKPIAFDVLFGDFYKGLEKEKGSAGAARGFKRSFEMRQPVVPVTPAKIQAMGAKDAYTSIKNSRQAELALAAINGEWKTSGAKVKAGGVKAADFVRAIRESKQSASLTKYTQKDINDLVKSGDLKLFQLSDSQIYFALKKREDGGTELVSVMNNEAGATGVAGPSIIIKAIQEGATHLDGFAVPSKKHPRGFLHDLYRLFGFKETERFKFDESMYLQENRQAFDLADLKHGWRNIDKWDETMGDPDVVFMELELDEGSRQSYGRDFIEPSEGGVSRATTEAEAREGEVPQRDRADSVGRGARRSDPRSDTGDAGVVRGSDVGRSRVGTSFRGLIDEVLSLSPADLKNLGVDPAKVAKAKSRLNKGGALFLPDKVGPETIRSVDELAAAAMSERTWRTWYQRYSKQLNTVFGVAGAKTFEKVLGATSQATGVAGNVTLALRAYAQMITGQPFEGFLEGVVKNLERIKRDEMVQGQKIGEFAKATTGDSSGVAIDRHVARIIYGRKNLQQGSTPSITQVRKGKKLIGEVAKKLGWKPREVQAALWAAQIELDARAKGIEPKKESYDTYLGEEYRAKRGKTPVKEIIRVAREIERGNAELISSTLGSKGSGAKSRPDRSGFVARERGNEQTVKFLPEELGPNTEQLLVALGEGAISRQQWDVAVELMRPVAKEVTLPTEDNVILSQENLAKLEATMKEDQLPLIGEAEKLPEGFDVALRIDIPTYNKSLLMMAEGQLDSPVYAITIHHKAENKSKLGRVIGYDVFSRILEPKFHITSQKIGMKIGTGERNKTTMATAEGKLVKSRELPSMKGWTQVGMNPKRHGYFYDRATGKAVKSGAEAISYGNTVFVRKPKFFTEAERLDLFSYLPEKVGDSEMRTTEEGYRAIKRDNKIRVYTPKGKLIGVASSAKIANQLYRRHIKRNESRTNNLRQ